jgi:hypothetical protein
MTNPARCGTLVISVDLEGSQSGDSPLCDDAALATVDTLLGVLRDARMPATFASRRPSHSDAVTEALRESIDHEIALGCHAQTSAQPSGIGRMRDLGRELQQAQRAGYRISTLMVEATPSSEALQGLCRLGITAIATPELKSISAPWLRPLEWLMGRAPHEPRQPCLLRYGLWEVPSAIELPMSLGILSRGTLRDVVRTAAACGDVLHLMIRLPQLRQGRAGGVKQVETVLQTAFDLRAERQLTIETVGKVVERLRTQRKGTPAESILRRAA